MGKIVRTKIPGFAWGTSVEPEDVGGFAIGSSYLFATGSRAGIAMGAAGIANAPDLTLVDSAESDLALNASGHWVDVLTDGWYAITAYLVESGAFDQVQISLLTPNSHLNSVDTYMSIDPALGGVDLTAAIAADILHAGDTVTLQGYGDNAGSSGTWDITDARLLIVRLS